MESRVIRFFAEASGGELVAGSPDLVISRVCTDSRKVQPGDLFLALPGDKYDGHNFVSEAVASGASAVLVCRSRLRQLPQNCAMVVVDDTRAALGRMASAYRRDFDLPVVAVCGSNGKTTTKTLIASVLGRKLATLSSEASFNNDVGVPVTLLRLDRSQRAAVLEAGTNHPGELRPLLNMIAPNYGVLTNIGREHLEFFGDLAGVAREEGTLAEVLPASGKLFLNADDEWTDRIASRAQARVVRVGQSAAAEWRAVNVRMDSEGVSFRVEAAPAAYAGEYRLNLLGRHQVTNALFAIAVGSEFGVPPAEVQAGLAGCRPANMRMQSGENRGVRILNDAYNANADSMSAALQTLAELPCKGRRVAVLGDMAELGSFAQEAHEEVGRLAATLGVGQLFAVGKMASVIGRSARQAGLNRVLEFADVESAALALRNFVRPGDVVLVKASRSTRLERVAEMLRASECSTT